jgi:hypothetical protein
LLKRHAAESQEVAAFGKRMRAVADEFWQMASDGERLIKQHDRTVGELEGLGEPRLKRAAAVLSENVGEMLPSTSANASEYGKRVFTLLQQILEMNPSHLMRARLTRRQAGRFGESFQARDQRRKLSWIKCGVQGRNENPRRNLEHDGGKQGMERG